MLQAQSMIHELVLRSSVKVHPFFKMAPLLFKPFVLISGNLFPYGPGLVFSKASGYSNISHAMPNHPDTAIYAMPCQSIRIQQYMPCHAKSCYSISINQGWEFAQWFFVRIALFLNKKSELLSLSLFLKERIALFALL